MSFSKKLLIIFSLSVAALAIVTVLLVNNNTDYVWDEYESAVITMPSGEDLLVAIADTPEKRTQGLSFTSHIPKGRGMLFIFDEIDYYAFWMKDMRFPIDILWLDDKGVIVHIAESASPDSYPESFTPPVPALSVLELPAGSCKEKYICSVGSVLEINK